MTTPQLPVLEFPEMLYGHTEDIIHKVRTMGQSWAREYLETGAFSLPRRMLPVPPGELLVMDPVGHFDVNLRPRWQVHLFTHVFMSLSDGVPKEERQRMEESFEAFCLSTPWGALFQSVSPSPPESAERMARRLAALLRFWDVLQAPRYAFWAFQWRDCSLEELMDYLYRKTLEAWCPGGPASVREHLVLTVERMARATREECMEAVLRFIPVLLELEHDLKHREVLSDPDFLRERLAALPPKDFERCSSACLYAVSGLLADWDGELERQ